MTPARVDTIVNMALSWRVAPYTPNIAGATLLHDGRPFRQRNVAVARSIQRSNERISVFDSLYLADLAVSAALRDGLDPEFLAATILQESAFDPRALSSAGAVGIAQFTLETAQSQGIDPFDPADAIAGASRLLAQYVSAYRAKYPDPYAAALAAYNAGPGAVAQYRGVPPYAETREYISDIYERWARILRDEKRAA